jgi:hypothetical protein
MNPTTIIPGWFNPLSGYTQQAAKQKHFQNNRKQTVVAELTNSNNKQPNKEGIPKILKSDKVCRPTRSLKPDQGSPQP